MVEQVHHGPDPATLRRELQKKGFHVFEVKPRGMGIALSVPRLGRRRRKPVSAQKFLIFNQELSALLAAGLPLLQALDLMLERMRDPDFRAVMEDIRERVESGQELSAAFEAHGDFVPRLYPSTLRAGERTGDLVRVIRRFVHYLALVLDARKRVVSALVYPAVLIVLSVTMIVVMTVFVVPSFAEFYDDLDAELPMLTQVTMGIGTFLRERMVAIIISLVVGSVLLRRWFGSSVGRLAVDRWRLRVPVLGRVFHGFAVSEFTRALSTLLEGGFPLVPSLEIAVGAVGNTYVRDRLTPTVQMVTEGQPLHRALDQSDVVDDMAIDMVKVGEATGALDEMLNNVSDFLDQDVEIRMQRMLSLLEPFMLVFMGLIVALLLVSVYLPMFAVLGQVR